jgi:hypothetical protein
VAEFTTRNSNTLHVAAGDNLTLSIKNIKVTSIYYCATATNSTVVLQDVTTGAIKHSLQIATSKDFAFFDYSDMPIVFPNGIETTSNTGMFMILTIQETRS